MNLEQELYRYIVSRYLQGCAPDGFDLDTHLIDGGILDLAACLNLVSYAEREYAIRFAESELVPEQFASIRVFARAIERKIAAHAKRGHALAVDPRYEQLAPQLRIYQYDLGAVLAPYVMRSAPARFRSPVVNTDDYGYRLAYDAEGVVDSQSWWQRERRALAIGNSFVFSEGATSDQTSLVSLLNAHSDYSFLNLGLRVGNSTQELIAALPFLPSAACVLICSGGANLNLNLLRDSNYDLYGCFAGEEIFARFGETEFQQAPELLTRSAAQLRERFVKCARPAAQVSLTEEEAEARVERALALERRDLQFIVRACGPAVPIFFALQLFSTLAKPNLTVEEQELFELFRHKDKVWSKVIEPYSVKYLSRYSQSLARICSELGVAYTDLNDLDFEGWCFLDHGHLTDHGYRQVAQHLAGWMKSVAGKQVNK